MKVGFDISQTGRLKAGCGFFANELIRQIAQIDHNSQYFLYKVFGDHFLDPDFNSMIKIKKSNFQEKIAHNNSAEARQFWNIPSSSLLKMLGDPDIIHANNFFCPIRKIDGVKWVYTLYDLSFMNYPEYTTEANRLACFDGVFRASLHADFIIAISEHSRTDFLRIFPHYPNKKIKVIYPASRFSGVEIINKPRKFSQLMAEKFWLTVGTIEPRKNQFRTLEAYAELKLQSINQLPLFPLVFVGGNGWMMDDFHRKINSLGLQNDVILWGYATEDELAWLYRNCYSFLYPSLFEGFGLPVLEAMAFGAAVVTSNVSSLPEVAGSAGILINPLEVNELVDAMHRLLKDDGLRTTLKQLAIDKAKQFSWQSAATSVLEIYSDVVNGS